MRKKYQLEEAKRESDFLSEKERFVASFLSGSMTLINTTSKKVTEQLSRMNFKKFNGTWDHLLYMRIQGFTSEKVRELKKKTKESLDKVKKLEKTTPFEMWLEELEKFEVAYSKTQKR